MISDWWFGTFFIVHFIYGIIMDNPSHWRTVTNSYFSRWLKPPTRYSGIWMDYEWNMNGISMESEWKLVYLDRLVTSRHVTSL
jgi:hypothetical protein